VWQASRREVGTKHWSAGIALQDIQHGLVHIDCAYALEARVLKAKVKTATTGE
jgi:hypothetical protein